MPVTLVASNSLFSSMASISFSAVVLAAGYSTRMGRDKALLHADGVPMWQRQRDVLRRAGAVEIFLSARAEQWWAASAVGYTAVVRDAAGAPAGAVGHDRVVMSGGPVGSGPLAGLVAGLDAATQPWLAVLAIDLPAITPEWFSRLLAGCRPGVGRVGRHHDYFEPLAAIYPQEMKVLAEAAWRRGDLSLQRLLTAAVAAGLMSVEPIGERAARGLQNWNEPRSVPSGDPHGD